MRLPYAILALVASTSLAAQTFQLHALVSAREIWVKSAPSWTEGGFGRFDVGADSPDDRHAVNVDVAQVGFDWTPATWLLVHADGVARREPSGTVGKRAGIVQAFADVYNDHWRLRAGSFWIPTSRENTGEMWSSPYTVTFSALNTWIGQEVRPVGADLQWSPNFYVTAGVTAFGGNDTMGTVLAERGWSLGNRLSVFDERIALPPPDLRVRPIQNDLDHRPGFAERIRVQLPERANLQVMHLDNRAKLAPLIDGQEPWLTKFDLVSAAVGQSSPTTLAAEWMRGDTELAFIGGTFLMDFDTGYVLVSHKIGEERLSFRAEKFTAHAHTPSPFDTSREHGRAYTIAWFHERDHVRYGAEYVRVNGDHPGAATVGFDPRSGGSTITAEVRYHF